MSHTNTALWNQLYNQNHIASPRFSLCYVKHPVVHFDGSHAGSLTFGGSDKRLHEAPMVYTPFDATGRFYEVKIRRVYINPGGGHYLTGPNKDIYLSKTATKAVVVDEDKMTLPLALNFFNSSLLTDYCTSMSAGVLVMIPIIIIYFIFQKQFIEGITMTGIK